MPTLLTTRMALLPLSRAMLHNRITHDTFDLDCELPAGPAPVHFPASWPGDPLPMYPGMLEQMGSADEIDGSFTAVDLAARVSVGALGTIGPPDPDGGQEIGYGFNPEVWGQGFASEAVGALVEHLLATRPIVAVVADTAVANRASERVLEKNGFVRIGTGWSDEDGDLTKWARVRPPAEQAATPGC